MKVPEFLVLLLALAVTSCYGFQCYHCNTVTDEERRDCLSPKDEQKLNCEDLEMDMTCPPVDDNPSPPDATFACAKVYVSLNAIVEVGRYCKAVCGIATAGCTVDDRGGRSSSEHCLCLHENCNNAVSVEKNIVLVFLPLFLLFAKC